MSIIHVFGRVGALHTIDPVFQEPLEDMIPKSNDKFAIDFLKVNGALPGAHPCIVFDRGTQS